MNHPLVVLAAGRGARLGEVAKALLPGDSGATFLAIVIGRARAAGAGPVVVVVGPPFAAEVGAAARALGAAVAENAHPVGGMATSVEVGFRHAQREWSKAVGALLWPVDHPHVESRTVMTLLARARPHNIVIPQCGSQGGHPTWFGRDLWSELVGCAREPDGARGIVRRDAARVDRVAVGDTGVVADVDVPADLLERRS